MKNNNNSYRSSSHRRTPWDDADVLSELETFISSEYKDHYKARHLKLTDSQKEIVLLKTCVKSYFLYRQRIFIKQSTMR